MTRAPLLLCVLAAGALAAPIPARLVYDASGTACPGKDALVTAVVRRLGMNPFDNSASSTLMVQVSPAPKGLSATVVRTKPDGSGTGRRELSSANLNCVELFETLSLEVALAVDPLAKTTPLPPPPPPPGLEPPPPPPTTERLAPASPMSYLRGDGPSDTPVERMTRGALLAERERLVHARPNSGLGFFIAGGGAIVGSVVLNALGFATQAPYSSAPYFFHIIGSAAGVAGVVLLVVGIVRRVVMSETFELFGLRIDEIDLQLEGQQRTGWVDPGPPSPQRSANTSRSR